jgi:hypothetical protein
MIFDMRGEKHILTLCFVAALMLLPQSTYAQTNASFKDQISAFYFSEEAFETTNHDRLDQLIKKLEFKRTKQTDDLQFLKTIFHKTHKRMLLRYNSLASTNETIENGQYGCLSGTILYAILLEHFGYSFDILEVPNHVFIRVYLLDEIYYLESTIPNDGLLTSKDLRNFQYASFSSENPNMLSIVSQQGISQTNEKQFKIIGYQELKGLQHFNESVRLFKEGEYDQSIEHAIQAYVDYPNDKNEKLMHLIVSKILKVDDLSPQRKMELLSLYETKSPLQCDHQLWVRLTPASTR